MTKGKKLLAWFLGALLAVCLVAGLKALSYLRFENSDDILIVKSFMGFEGGAPARFHQFVHTFPALFLGWLSGILPGVAWFSLLQLFALWLSVTVISKCIIRRAWESGAGLLAGGIAAGLCAGVIGAFACARVQYVTTSGLLGAAAAAQLCSLDKEKKPFAGALFSALLLLGCYLLRGESLLAALPFYALAALWLLIRRKEARKPLAAALLAGAVLLAGSVGVREWEKSTPENREFFAFHQARNNLMDYREEAFDCADDQTLAEIGWTRAEMNLVRRWYFMDENITAEALTRLAAAAPEQTVAKRLSAAFPRAGAFFAKSPRHVAALALALCLAALCMLSREKSRWLALGALALMLLMPPYLGFRGRLLGRAVDCAYFPALALLFCLAVTASPRKGAALCLCGLCLLTGGWTLRETWDAIDDRPDTVSATREADLEGYALENPGMLILRAPDLLRDTRLLPDVSAGMPENILLWGDWYCRTPSWYHQLAQYGFDGRHFTAADFLRENLLFATADESPSADLTEYLTAETGKPVTPELAGSRGELRFFRFR